MVGSPDPTTMHKAAAAVSRRAPVALARQATRYGGRMASLFAGDRRVMVERNLRRAKAANLTDEELNRSAGAMFESYARYYYDSFRLPSLSAEEIDEGFSYTGFEHIAQPVADGIGPLLILPHLGGWEWAAFWLTKVMNIGVTAIVEPLEPPDLFEWFQDFRESLGMSVVPVGKDAAPAILESVKRRDAVCMLSDRAVAGASAVPVEFFGERTMLPAGPATVALRTGAPLVPVAVYFRGEQHFADVRPAVPAIREGRFRDDVQRITQDLAVELERFIRAAPEQWHVFQPGWPSDFRALGRPLPDTYKGL
ncbi:MAG: phosphatidylinositol mannoside acyltransferase [Acidimicrobiales bacterium]|nr:phosphatidylinositol mannoside acyltransferase [Acidimicrobiales bacterium]RZV46872.1 MAG: phosphatidylinositol mannoside acyltransferase [Acidimicrobiales bacterium]